MDRGSEGGFTGQRRGREIDNIRKIGHDGWRWRVTTARGRAKRGVKKGAEEEGNWQVEDDRGLSKQMTLICCYTPPATSKQLLRFTPNPKLILHSRRAAVFIPKLCFLFFLSVLVILDFLQNPPSLQVAPHFLTAVPFPSSVDRANAESSFPLLTCAESVMRRGAFIGVRGEWPFTVAI